LLILFLLTALLQYLSDHVHFDGDVGDREQRTDDLFA
jgi:hypothetical protein